MPLKVLCGGVWSETSAPEKSAVQLEWKVPPVPGEGKLFLELSASVHSSMLSCAGQQMLVTTLNLAIGE